MLKILKIEILKLKRSWIFIVSLISCLILPFFALLLINAPAQGQVLQMEKFMRFLQQNHVLHALLVGILLYPLMTIFIFNIEFQERTLPVLLSIPVPRGKLILSKFVLLSLWALLMASVMLCIILIFAFITGMENISLEVFFKGTMRFYVSSILMILLTIPIVLLTLLAKNYIIPLGFAILSFIVNIIAINTKDFIFYFPWSIPFVLTNFRESVSYYQILLSLTILLAMFFLSTLLLVKIFRQMDIK